MVALPSSGSHHLSAAGKQHWSQVSSGLATFGDLGSVLCSTMAEARASDLVTVEAEGCYTSGLEGKTGTWIRYVRPEDFPCSPGGHLLLLFCCHAPYQTLCCAPISHARSVVALTRAIKMAEIMPIFEELGEWVGGVWWALITPHRSALHSAFQEFIYRETSTKALALLALA